MATIKNWHFSITFFAAIGCGLMAGLLFAFSTSVMKALAQLPPAAGIAAMQTINITIINPVFGVAFGGTAVACIFVMINSLLQRREPGTVYALIGSALYLVGTLLVTVVFNVPKNNALAVLAPTAPDSVIVWSSYVTSWTAWNHIRTLAALVAAALLTLSLCD